MAGAAGGPWARLMGVRYCPVVLASPYPAGECLRRLAAVTTYRGAASWYLDTKTVGHPDPRFRGHISPSRIIVARWADARGRRGFAPWLDARLESAVGGGTTLTGTIGPPEGSLAFSTAFVSVVGLMAAGAVAAGVHLLLMGHLAELTAVMLAPLALAALIAVLRTSLRLPERTADALLREFSESFGSTVVPAGPVANDSSA